MRQIPYRLLMGPVMMLVSLPCGIYMLTTDVVPYTQKLQALVNQYPVQDVNAQLGEAHLHAIQKEYPKETADKVTAQYSELVNGMAMASYLLILKVAGIGLVPSGIIGFLWYRQESALEASQK